MRPGCTDRNVTTNAPRTLQARGAVGQEEYDRYDGDYQEAVANLDVARANRDLAALNLGYTKVTAPVGGRVSRYVVTVGNLIQSGDQNGGTMLTTLVSVDPMYVYFDMDERTVLRVRQLIRDGKARSAREAEWPVSLGLATEEGSPHQGRINFEDNQVNPKTGTLRVRGVFRNKDEALSPGLFARIRVPIGQAHRALLVTDRAIETDQGQKVLYVVNEKNEVVARPVRLGALHHGLREIAEGLNAGERVIVNGLQQVRPGVEVEPKLVDMPNSGWKSSGRPQKVTRSSTAPTAGAIPYQPSASISTSARSRNLGRFICSFRSRAACIGVLGEGFIRMPSLHRTSSTSCSGPNSSPHSAGMRNRRSDSIRVITLDISGPSRGFLAIEVIIAESIGPPGPGGSCQPDASWITLTGSHPRHGLGRLTVG